MEATGTAKLLRARQLALRLWGDERQAWRVYELVKANQLPVVRLGRGLWFDPGQIAAHIEKGGGPVA